MKPWHKDAVQQLRTQPVGGYLRRGPAATEPTALAALALTGAGLHQHARPALDWLAASQQSDGRLGTTTDSSTPGWPTALAILAWSADSRSHVGDATRHWEAAVNNAVAWTLQTRGETLEKADHLGHDVTLTGWPWVSGTHSWVEPTALHVLALKAVGKSEHPRTREAVRLLVDRQLPNGGCNLGNTTVLGNQLRPHVQPTGLAMLALSGERLSDARVEGSLRYLERSALSRLPTASLAWAILGLTAHGRRPSDSDARLGAAYARLRDRDRAAYKQALTILAAQGESSPILPLANSESRP